MPRFPRKALRRALLLAATASLAVWVATAWAAPVITIERPDATTLSVDLATVDPEPSGTTYKVRRYKDQRPERVPIDEYYSLASVLESAGALDGFKELTLDAEGRLRVADDQLNDVPPPALYIDENGEVRFIRDSAGPTDLNGVPELFDLEVTRITQSSESSLRVRVQSRGGKAGEPVVLVADLYARLSSKRYEVTWDFDDGSRGGRGERVEHSFDKPGRYRVTAKVTTRDSDGEQGEVIDEGVGRMVVKIGEPKPADGEEPGAGGDNTAAGAPDSGAYQGASGAGSAYGGSSSTTPYTPTDSFGDLDLDGDTPSTARGDTVEGALLASVSTPVDPAAAAGDQRAASAGDPDFDVPESDDKVPPAAWAGLGALALVGAGAGLESGRRPQLRRPRLRLSLPRR